MKNFLKPCFSGWNWFSLPPPAGLHVSLQQQQFQFKRTSQAFEIQWWWWAIWAMVGPECRCPHTAEWIGPTGMVKQALSVCNCVGTLIWCCVVTHVHPAEPGTTALHRRPAGVWADWQTIDTLTNDAVIGIVRYCTTTVFTNASAFLSCTIEQTHWVFCTL